MHSLILLKSKIHNATVTGTNLHYEGSIEIDLDLIEAAKLVPYEKVHVLNINTGSRLETYVIVGKRGSRVIALNGAAARAAQVGDRLIILSYAVVPAEDQSAWQPVIIRLDAQNRPI